MTTESPFVPGARVAVDDGWGNHREAFVEKVYKNGNFTLKGDRQQWRPHSYTWGDGRPTWHANKTGDTWDRSSVKVWDETTDAEIRKNLAEQARRDRLRAIQKQIDRLRVGDATDAMLDQIDAALATRQTDQAQTELADPSGREANAEDNSR